MCGGLPTDEELRQRLRPYTAEELIRIKKQAIRNLLDEISDLQQGIDAEEETEAP